jgi:hypothetical protein
MSWRPASTKLVKSHLKNKIQRKLGSIAQGVEHLPNLCEALGSVSSVIGKKLKLIINFNVHI